MLWSFVPSWCWTLFVLTAMASGALDTDPTQRTVVGVQGADVNLTCTDKTWSVLFYILWNISLQGGHLQCRIVRSDKGQDENTCGDSMALLNSSSGVPYLLVPNLSLHHEGLYKCQVSFQGGERHVHVNLVISVPPRVSAWLEWQGSRRVAVCVADEGRPIASVRWRNLTGNLTGNLTTTTTTLNNTDGSFTVRSTLDLPEDAAMENLTCVVNHSSWEEEFTVWPIKASSSQSWMLVHVLLPTCASLAALVTLAALYFGRKKLTAIRPCWKSGCKASQEVTSPSTLDVEELEPYACYSQRVNSFYNSYAGGTFTKPPAEETSVDSTGGSKEASGKPTR